MPGPDRAAHLLILGGTGEAAALAAAVLARFGSGVTVTTSLAGRTTQPKMPAGAVRSGGFGGVAALAAERVMAVIDATHPFAAQISAQAVAACAASGVKRLRLDRPAWPRHPGDRWIEVDDVRAAAAALPALGRRAFLTIGGRGLEAFAALPGMHFLVRLVEAPPQPLALPSAELLLGRGPFTLAEERLIMERHGIDMLVTKASGGTATAAKLDAARERKLPVVMLRRPAPPPGPHVTGIAAALDWLDETLPSAEGETRL
jgi:precorrin-6A/cobalt-precorrin-6A reductase